MITSRPLTENDRPLLDVLLKNDDYHKGTDSDFFFDNRSVCNVYEDDKGPVVFCRATKALRIDLQFIDNADRERNAEAIAVGFAHLVEDAKAAGFTEILAIPSSLGLRVFCEKKLGFVESHGEMRRYL